MTWNQTNSDSLKASPNARVPFITYLHNLTCADLRSLSLFLNPGIREREINGLWYRDKLIMEQMALIRVHVLLQLGGQSSFSLELNFSIYSLFLEVRE